MCFHRLSVPQNATFALCVFTAVQCPKTLHLPYVSPPSSAPRLYICRVCFTAFQCFNTGRHSRQAEGVECTLLPGDSLYIPPGVSTGTACRSFSAFRCVCTLLIDTVCSAFLCFACSCTKCNCTTAGQMQLYHCCTKCNCTTAVPNATVPLYHCFTTVVAGSGTTVPLYHCWPAVDERAGRSGGTTARARPREARRRSRSRSGTLMSLPLLVVSPHKT